ncbi:cysteine--tRNA ligase [Blastomonas sp.]|uniref:cysteine--tRNA ligase n=1 Tax=Blastomonas sp. TaxID=1909299 RepID=UPI00406A434F
MTSPAEPAPLMLFNSLTRSLEAFEPVHPGEARVYSCGPTVYNYAHLGNMRAYVFADTLGRVLSFKGYRLRHIINITDVGHLTDDADQGEDKLEKAAAERAQSIWDIARHYTEAFWEDIRALNIRQPAEWSIATDYVLRMIEFARSIADKHCYELPSGLYFDVSTVSDYGSLARAATEAGEGRIEAVEGKRNAQDFAIWRRTPEGETRQMEWESPWGPGAPGWHLECSVMSEALLGFPFDIHTGGIDHREIHHPNEIAQNQAFACSHGSGARFWMHNNFLIDRTGKMSKSSGEFLRLPLLVSKGIHPLAYRLMCLQAHYRSELEFSWDNLLAALTRLKRLVMAVEGLKKRAAGTWRTFWYSAPVPGASNPILTQVWDKLHPKLQPLLQEFDSAVSDDLKTPLALTVLENVVSIKKVPPESKLYAVELIDHVLGFGLMDLSRDALRIRPQGRSIDEAAIQEMLEDRKEAKAEGNYSAADAIRESLALLGVSVMDGDPLGWEWRIEV